VARQIPFAHDNVLIRTRKVLRLRGMPKKVEVKFTEQQMMLLEKLKQEGTFGKTYEEIIPRVFREYVKQTFGVGGLK
jgi:uncharacterized protein with PIN domain